MMLLSVPASWSALCFIWLSCCAGRVSESWNFEEKRNGGWTFRFQDTWTLTGGERVWNRRNKVIHSLSVVKSCSTAGLFFWHRSCDVSVMFCCQGMAKESVTKKSAAERSMFAETPNWKSEDGNARQTSGFVWAPEEYRPFTPAQSRFRTWWGFGMWW